MTKMELEMRINVLEKILRQLKEELQRYNQSETGINEERRNETEITKAVLDEIGVRRGLSGYDYLVNEIIETIENPKSKLYNNTCKKFSTKYFVVERDIRTVKLNVFKNKKNTLITTLFKEYQEVPTNRKFIQILAQYINELLNNEEEGKILKDINKAEQNEIKAYVKSITRKCLDDVGIKLKLKGYDYLVEEIIARIEDPSCKLYLSAAQKYSEPYYNVNINIKNAKIKAFKKESQTELLKNLFQTYSEIPSNKEFINVLACYVEETM